jgi:hypothetical protein
MIKQALAAALSIGIAASGISALAHEGTSLACGDEKKPEKPKPQPKPSLDVVACGDEKKTEKPKPQPKPSFSGSWAIG